MRNSMFVLAALAGLTIIALPAAAESDEGSCGAPSSVVPSGPIDLQAIPMQNATTPKTIKGVGDGECDDTSTRGVALKAGHDASDDD